MVILKISNAVRWKRIKASTSTGTLPAGDLCHEIINVIDDNPDILALLLEGMVGSSIKIHRKKRNC